MADILVLEDDDILRRTIVGALGDFGYPCDGAATAKEALTLARGRAYDVVIADVRIPEMDGIECLEVLRTIRPRSRFIVITGYASAEAPARAIRAEAEDYLHKPFRVQELLSSLERLLEAERKRAGYHRLIQAAVAGYRRLVGQGAPTESLEKPRDRAFRSFFVGVRAGMLSPIKAHAIWTRLERLEDNRERLQEGSSRPQEVEDLTEGYDYLVDLLGAAVRAGPLRLDAQPHPGEVTREEFSRLFDRVRRGVLSPEQLKFAHFLRVLDPGVRESSADLHELYHEIWGEEKVGGAA